MSKRDDLGPDAAYNFPLAFRLVDTSNRRSAAGVYLGAAVIAGTIVFVSGLTLMWITGVIPLLVIAVYQYVAGRPMNVADVQAIEVASEEVPFEVGHGSATLGFRGFAARPVWQVLVFELGRPRSIRLW